MAELIYNYDPKPNRPLFEEGATIGWLVIHEGEPAVGDPIRYAKCVAMTDEDGYVFVEVTDEFRDGRIVEP
jgi:hypothetical protein